jgi:hypothetical protein
MKGGTSSPTAGLARLHYNPDLPPPASCWPDETQRLLLQACLCEKDKAASAFQEWDSRVDVLKLDHGSNRLMALLFRNLEKQGIRSPDHERLKGNWRYYWYQNKLLLGEFLDITSKMEADGIPLIALKGIPLALFYYRDMGARPMSDFDILVPSVKITQAITFLKDRGYEPKFGHLEQRIPYTNGCGFTKKGSTEIDLHWHVLHDCFYQWSDDSFWEGARIEKGEGISLSTLCAEDHFLHACAHGMRYNKIPPLRWLVDAWMILKEAGNRMDFDRLIQQAERRRLASPVQKTIRYFEKHLSLPIDHPAALATNRMKVSFYEKVEYFHRIHPSENLPSYIPLWFQYQRWKQGGDARLHKKGFLGYYAQRRKLPDRLAALLYILKTTFKKSMIPWFQNRQAQE